MSDDVPLTGFSLCDESAMRAVAVRRLGILPFAAALRCPDIGEAKLQNGERLLIMLGRNINKQQQLCFADNTNYSPIWIGDEYGRCELVLGTVFAGTIMQDWVWAGIRLTMDTEENWNPCEATSAADGPSEKS